MTLVNNGNAALVVASVALGGGDAGDFEIVTPAGCANGSSLPAGSSCNVTVRFVPKTTNPALGNRAANLVFTFNNNNGPQTLISALNGQAVAASPAASGFAQISPAALSFGPAGLGGATPSQTVTITNTGNAPLTFGATAPTIAGGDAGDFEIVGTSTCAANGTLNTTASCQITVRFAPKTTNPTPGNRAAVINVAFTNNAGGNNQQIPLNGQALAGQSAVASVAPPTLSFGATPLGGASVTQTVRVTNTGTAPLTLGATPFALAGADQGDFQVVNTSSCAAGGTLAPDAFCDVVLRFAPVGTNPTPGNRAATLTLNFANAANGNAQIVALDGQAISGGGAIITPPNVDFGTARLGGASAPATVTVRNGGTTPLTFAATAGLSGGDTGDFQLVDAGGCTAGATLQPDATCQAIVRFTPKTTNPALGNRTSALRFTFTNNAGGNAQDVPLSGSATDQATPVARITPPSLSFGTVQIGKFSASQTVTVRNIGDAPLTFGATPFGISGANLGDFEVVGTASCPAGGSLAPDATCQIEVRFAPKTANTNPGNRAAVLNITFTNNGGGNNQQVPLSGIATTQPTALAQIAPPSVAFGTVQIGKASGSQTITVTNVGDAPLTFTGTPFALGGGDQNDFEIVGTPTCPANGSLAPDASCQVVVRFRPLWRTPHRGIARRP